MAEVVGLAASVAGLAALAGQIFQGGLFIREFFEDIRDAPTEVRDLRDELDLFTFVASDTESLFHKAKSCEIPLPKESFTRVLQRCLSTVEEIGQKLDQWIGKSSGSKRDWWGRMKVVSRKKTLKEYLRRLERAKSQLVILQANLTQTLLLLQNQMLRETRTSLDVHHQQISTITREMQGQGTMVVSTVDDQPVNIESLERAVKQNVSSQWTETSDQTIAWTGSPDHYQRRSSMKQYRRTLEFWVLKFDIKTYEQDGDRSPDGEDTRKESRPMSISTQIRIPYFSQRIFNFAFQQSRYTAGFDMQIRTRNIRPISSPIFHACRNFDIQEVQRLLQTLAASPTDYAETLSGGHLWTMSMIDIILGRIARCHSSQAKDIRRGIELITYLLSLYNSTSRIVEPGLFNESLALMNSPADDLAIAPYLEVIRSIVRQSDENPFEVNDSISHRIALENSEREIAKLLIEQDYHPLDGYEVDGNFIENDRQMLADPEGLRMKDAVRNGASYRTQYPLGSGRYTGGKYGPTGMHAIFNAIGSSASHPRCTEIKACCRNRLAFFINRGCDINAQRTFYLDKCFPYQGDKPSRMSPLEFAVSLGLDDFLRGVLASEGWSQERVDEAFRREKLEPIDSISELFIETNSYQSHESLRAKFMQSLISGSFSNLSTVEIEELDNEAAFTLGTDFGEIYGLVCQANASSKLRRMPGAWKERDGAGLIPGIDFNTTIRPLLSPLSKRKLDIRLWIQPDLKEDQVLELK